MLFRSLSSDELAQTLGQFHAVFGQVVDSMLESIAPNADINGNARQAKTEKHINPGCINSTSPAQPTTQITFRSISCIDYV